MAQHLHKICAALPCSLNNTKLVFWGFFSGPVRKRNVPELCDDSRMIYDEWPWIGKNSKKIIYYEEGNQFFHENDVISVNDETYKE